MNYKNLNSLVVEQQYILIHKKFKLIWKNVKNFKEHMKLLLQNVKNSIFKHPTKIKLK